MTKEICVLKIDETVAESAAKDSITLMVVSLLVYISMGSKFWTLITGLMFIVFMWAKIGGLMKRSKKEFTNTDQVRAWLDRIDAEKESEQ